MRATMLAAVMACGLATGAEAAVFTVSAPVGRFAPDTGEAFVQIPSFNAALGTLTDARVTTNATLSEQFSVIALSNVPAPTSGTFVSTFKASIAGASSQAPAQTVTIGLPGTASVNISNSFTAPAATIFSDGGPVFVEYSAYFTPVAGVFQGSISSVRISATGTVTVAYDYTPVGATPGTSVPEPISIALMGTGLAGIGVMRRRS